MGLISLFMVDVLWIYEDTNPFWLDNYRYIVVSLPCLYWLVFRKTGITHTWSTPEPKTLTDKPNITNITHITPSRKDIKTTQVDNVEEIPDKKTVENEMSAEERQESKTKKYAQDAIEGDETIYITYRDISIAFIYYSLGGVACTLLLGSSLGRRGFINARDIFLGILIMIVFCIAVLGRERYGKEEKKLEDKKQAVH
ncbi:MAG: hypothetical protein QW728_00710 [Thermoplasmata archaeon]